MQSAEVQPRSEKVSDMLESILKNKSLLAIALALLPSSAMAQNETRNGVVLGGVTGALIGGVIGKQNRETTEGALIGGAVGAVAGGLLGNHQQQQTQQRQAQQRYYEQQRAQRYYQHPGHHPVYQNGYVVHQQPVYVQSQPVYTQTQPVYVQSTPVQTQVTVPQRRGVTVDDIMTLARNGVSENVIINHIDSTGVAYQMTVDDVVSMSEAGVSDSIIESMQNATIVGGSSAAIPRTVPTGSSPIASQPTNASSRATTTSRVTRSQVGQPTSIRNSPTPAIRPESTEPILMKPVPLSSGKF